MVAVAAPRVVSVAVAEPQAPSLTQGGVLTMLRLAARSQNPAVRQAAIDAAAAVGLDPARYGVTPLAV